MSDKQVSLIVRGNEYRISFISNYVIIQFAKIDEKIKLAETYRTKSNEVTQKVSNGKMLYEEGKKILEGYAKELTEATDGVLETRFDLVREVLETNGYEFDRKWWERKTTPADINTFLYSCYVKDFSEKEVADAHDGKKKPGA